MFDHYLASRLLAFGALLSGTLLGRVPAATFFQETFEDSNLTARGWYDGTGLVLSPTEHIPGSGHSAEYRFLQGATQPTSGGAIRRKFPESDSVYVGFWVKYSANYTGSNQPYHPHEFFFMTNRNGDWDGMAFTHLTAYVEQNEGVPLIAIQDGQNIDQNRINQDLRAVTENRAVAGCNGTEDDGYSTLSCYDAGGLYCNGKTWSARQVYFQDEPGAFCKNDWHRIEAYFQMNTIQGVKGVADGVVRYWYDGALLIERTNVSLRTGANADMRFNQFLIAPYIGDGSPVDQTLWVDDLTVGDARPGDPEGETSGPYFKYDAEDRPDGAWVAQPPFFPQPWQEPDTLHPKRGKIIADPTAPQGARAMRWDVTEAVRHDLYTEISFSEKPPADPRTYYYAFFVRFDRLDGQDIWHRGGPEAESFDKAFEVIGNGIRWTVNFGERGMSNREDRFSVFLSNPDYHLNPEVESWDSYYQNHASYSRSNSIQLEYERWHAIVFAMKWATDTSGEVALWVNGEKVLEYRNIKTVRGPGTFDRLQIWGTIAQPAYDAPPHSRKVDALIFTDVWQDILDGGYLLGAAGPTITAVTGEVQTGETLTIAGARLNDEAKAGWHSFFVDHPTAWSFEGGAAGQNIGADGYGELGAGVSASGVYDTNVSILGAQSARFHIEGAASSNLEDYSIIDPDGGGANDYWIRMYVRWNLTGGWPNSHIKMVMCVEGGPDSYYFQPAITGNGDPELPSQMVAVYDSTSHPASIPSGQIENHRWYAVEVHWRSDETPYVFDAWMDGVQIVSAHPRTPGPMDWLLFGLINACCMGPGFALDHWVDGFAVGSSRIYPSAMVEVGDGPDYATATRVTQELQKIADAEIKFKLDLSGLGSGPYYLWVINNYQERSQPYVLGQLPSTLFLRGDSNVDDATDISDAVTILGFLFLGSAVSDCQDAADLNDDGKVDISDPVRLLGHLFLGSERPPEPFGSCGIDPTADGLGCKTFGICQ